MITTPTAGPTERWVPTVVVGGVLWLTWAVVFRPDWTVVLLLLSPFVLLPLGLRLAASAVTGPVAPLHHQLARLTPPFAATAAASFVPEPGMLAGLLSTPWLAFTLGVAWSGAVRLLSRRSIAEPGIGADAGLIFVAVGGSWLTISRAGLNPLGFGDVIVELTAVHFHYAGFALPIVAGFAAAAVDRSTVVPLAVIVGVPFTAVGITVGGRLEWVAATTMALAGIATAGLLLQLGARQTGSARWLIAAAGLSLLAGMNLALGRSWSIQFGWSLLGVDSMAATHGTLNALGFGLLGLVGLNLAPSTPVSDDSETHVHLGRPATTTMQRIAERANHQQPTNSPGLLDRPTPAGYRRMERQRQVDHNDFAAASAAIRRWSGHDTAGVRLCPSQPPVAVGETLALTVPVGPVTISATCRIVDVVDEPDRYGFTYATLPHHPEDGEESFIVSRHDDGRVDVVITAVWRAATVSGRVCPPLTRLLQRRITSRYLTGIASSYNAPTQGPERPCN